MFLISSHTIQTSSDFSESSSFRKIAYNTHFSDELLDFSKTTKTSSASIPWGMLHGLLYHSAVFICSACPSFIHAWSFYVRNPRDSLLADEGSAGLRSHGTHGRLSHKGSVNAGRDSCVLTENTILNMYCILKEFNPESNYPRQSLLVRILSFFCR